MIVSTESPIPDVSIIEVDNFQHVITLTATATYTAGQTNGPMDRIFNYNGGQAITLLLLLNVPIMMMALLLNKRGTIDPRIVTTIVLAFIFIIDYMLTGLVKTPDGSPMMPLWGIPEQILCLFVVLLRKR
jgi:hypothetical protein